MLAMLRILSLSALICVSGAVRADCEALLPDLIKKYHPSRTSDMAVCKVWPADESKTIAVLPLPQGSGEDDSYDLDVLLVDTQSGKLLTRDYQPNALDSDAIRLTGFEIDTARYRLNAETRAFGVRIYYSGSSRANPYSLQLLSMYVVKNGVLTRIVNQLPISSSGGKWDTNCNGEFSESNRIISIAKSITNGYADLAISERSSTTVTQSQDNDCQETVTEKPRTSFILRFDGTEYPLPDENAAD
jgi:hypothetical protein